MRGQSSSGEILRWVGRLQGLKTQGCPSLLYSDVKNSALENWIAETEISKSEILSKIETAEKNDKQPAYSILVEYRVKRPNSLQ